MANLCATPSTGYFKPSANSVSGLSFCLAPIKWESAEFAPHFSARNAQLVLPQGWQDAGWSHGPILGRWDPSISAGCSLRAEQSTLLGCGEKTRVQPQPGRQPRYHCSLSWPGVLSGLLELGNMRVLEEGKRRDRVDSLTWHVILSSPLRQQYSVLLTQLKSLKLTTAPFLLT